MEFPKNKYDIIVVDPPWNLKKITRSKRPRQIGFDYKTMSLEEIKSLNINDISHEKSMLFLWTTQKYLFEAKDILECWGFKYLLTMVWEKTYGVSSGMPLHGFRYNCEFVLVGYKKKPDLWPKRKLIPACFQAENVRHSQKPDKFYEYVSVFGGKKIDIFARKQRLGWDVWGDEV